MTEVDEEDSVTAELEENVEAIHAYSSRSVTISTPQTIWNQAGDRNLDDFDNYIRYTVVAMSSAEALSTEWPDLSDDPAERRRQIEQMQNTIRGFVGARDIRGLWDWAIQQNRLLTKENVEDSANGCEPPPSSLAAYLLDHAEMLLLDPLDEMLRGAPSMAAGTKTMEQRFSDTIRALLGRSPRKRNMRNR